ncbi:MAG: hypothetical protein U0939_12605 [Pirellulales bacterium]
MNARLVNPILIILAVCGCSRLRTDQLLGPPIAEEHEAAAPAGAFEVQVDGDNLTFHAPQVAASKSRNYLPRIRQLLKDGDRAGARELVYRHPELALESLRAQLSAEPASAADSAVRFIAEEYDRWLDLPTQHGWSRVTSMVERDAAIRNYATARARVLETLSTGSVRESQALDLLRIAGATNLEVLKIDAARTAAIASLVALRSEQAARMLGEACNGAARIDGYQRSQLKLLQSDALRRAGKIAEADAAWSEAVVAAAQLTRHQPPLFDPAFWDAASYLRPVAVEWPASAVSEIASLSPIPTDALRGDAAERECVVWSTIGQRLLDRGDHEATLVALKRSEAASADAAVQGWCRVCEANALARVGQTSTATALLAGQLQSSDRRLAAAVAASFGSIKCQAGDVEAGQRLLKKGLESQTLRHWPGLADAEADLGLACLVQGEETDGLRWLRSARSRYEARGETTRVKQTLVNEREYWRYRKEESRVAELEGRLQAIDAVAPR